MSVWLAIPSKRPPEEVEPVLAKWRERGYKIALLTDDSVNRGADLQVVSVEYEGYAKSVNHLCERILSPAWDGQPGNDQQAEWIVAGGDDTLPDPNSSAEEIARACSYHFFAELRAHTYDGGNAAFSTFGVMQPTGDRWGEGQGGFANAPIDRVAGSPWIGREFARRMYGGAGPYWHEYRHQFVDEELQNVAVKLGVFWQRPDLCQIHNHWGRPRPGEIMAPSSRMPAFLAEANSAQHWTKYKTLFEMRKAQGFPGHEPIP